MVNSKLSYSIKGKGIPIVFLHGYLENRSVWKIFHTQFPGFQHIYIDLPGCGESPVMSEQTIENMGKIVHKLLQSLGVQRYFLAGHSMGGYVSLGIAEKFTDEIKGLILLHSHPFADNEEKKQNRLKEVAIVKNGKKDMLIQTFLPKLYSPGFTNAEATLASKKMALSTSAEGMMSCLQAMAHRTDRSEWLKNPPIPVLWFYGKNDQLFNYEMAEKFDVSSNVTKVLLSNSGHMGMYEETEKVVEMMDGFLLNNRCV